MNNYKVITISTYVKILSILYNNQNDEYIKRDNLIKENKSFTYVPTLIIKKSLFIY